MRINHRLHRELLALVHANASDREHRGRQAQSIRSPCSELHQPSRASTREVCTQASQLAHPCIYYHCSWQTRFSSQWPTARLVDMNRFRRLTAIIEREDDGFVALCPEVDVASQGITIEDAHATNARGSFRNTGRGPGWVSCEFFQALKSPVSWSATDSPLCARKEATGSYRSASKTEQSRFPFLFMTASDAEPC